MQISFSCKQQQLSPSCTNHAIFSFSYQDQESHLKAKTSADTNSDARLRQPREVLERLVLPPRDLESLLQDAVKSVAPAKVADSRCSKPLSTRVTLPPFPWSHSFNGHHKSGNDAVKSSNRSTCQGRWLMIRSDVSFIGAGTAESLLDLSSLTYDDGLVPPGKLKYKLPEIERSSSGAVAQHSSQHNLPSGVSSVPHPPQGAKIAITKHFGMASFLILLDFACIDDIYV